MYRIQAPVPLIEFVDKKQNIIVNPQFEAIANRKIIEDLLKLDP